MKQYKFKINGNDYNVAINSTNGNLADVTVNGVSYQVEMENSMPAAPAAAPVQAAPQQGSHLLQVFHSPVFLKFHCCHQKAYNKLLSVFMPLF